jgi:hypothetical protein
LSRVVEENNPWYSDTGNTHASQQPRYTAEGPTRPTRPAGMARDRLAGLRTGPLSVRFMLLTNLIRCNGPADTQGPREGTTLDACPWSGGHMGLGSKSPRLTDSMSTEARLEYQRRDMIHTPMCVLSRWIIEMLAKGGRWEIAVFRMPPHTAVIIMKLDE